MRRRLVVDMSSVLWTCLLVGEDKEFGIKVPFNGRQFPVNSAEYGYECVVNHFVKVLDTLEITPMDMILVVEGMNSKALRVMTLPQYKGSDKGTRDRPEECYVQFNILKERVIKAFTSLGAIAVSQDGIESDDVIGYLATHLDGEVIIDSNDGDLAVMITDEYVTDAKNTVWVWKQSKGELIKENPYGPFPCRHVVTYKSLVGDTGDKIPGAVGFGGTAWLNLLCAFGNEGLDVMLDLIKGRRLDELEANAAELPALKKIIAGKDMVYRSYDCARLYINKINTVRRPLNWTAGMVKPRAECEDERLRHWAGTQRLISAENYESAMKWMVPEIKKSRYVSFDIETSATDQGEDWLESTKKKADDADGVDVFGATLTSFSLTFGPNMNYTFFFTVDHVEEKGVTNITKDQAKSVLQAIPRDKIHVIQNVSFEASVIMENLGRLDDEEDIPELEVCTKD